MTLYAITLTIGIALGYFAAKGKLGPFLGALGKYIAKVARPMLPAWMKVGRNKKSDTPAVNIDQP